MLPCVCNTIHPCLSPASYTPRLPLSRKHRVSPTVLCCMLRSNHPLSLLPARSLPPSLLPALSLPISNPPPGFPRIAPFPHPYHPSSLFLTVIASNNPPPPTPPSFRRYRRLFRSRCAVLDVCHACFGRVHSALSVVDQHRRAPRRS